MADEITVLACQIDVPEITSVAERDHHVDRIAAAIDRDLSENGPVGLAVLPELSTLHYSRACFDQLPKIAESEVDGPSVTRLAAVAEKHGTPISLGFSRLGAGDACHISQVLINADGTAGPTYDKLHIAQFGDSMEKDYFSRGDHMTAFEIGGFTFGTIICYDMRSPELSRNLTRRYGMDVLLHPTAFCRDETFHTWPAFATTRAVENQVYFLSVNRAGSDFGESMLVEPWVDETVPTHRLGTDEELARFTLSKSKIDHARSNYPFLADARDDYTVI